MFPFNMDFMQKSITASVLLVLAFLQLGTMAVARGWVGHASGPVRRRLTAFHHVEGYVALAVILLIAYNCIFVAYPLVGVRTLRATLHVIVGPLVLALIFAKVLVGRGVIGRYSQMPVLGGLLFSAVCLQYLLSAAWFFLQYYTGILAGH